MGEASVIHAVTTAIKDLPALAGVPRPILDAVAGAAVRAFWDAVVEGHANAGDDASLLDDFQVCECGAISDDCRSGEDCTLCPDCYGRALRQASREEAEAHRSGAAFEEVASADLAWNTIKLSTSRELSKPDHPGGSTKTNRLARVDVEVEHGKASIVGNSAMEVVVHVQITPHELPLDAVRELAELFVEPVTRATTIIRDRRIKEKFRER